MRLVIAFLFRSRKSPWLFEIVWSQNGGLREGDVEKAYLRLFVPKMKFV